MTRLAKGRLFCVLLATMSLSSAAVSAAALVDPQRDHSTFWTLLTGVSLGTAVFTSFLFFHVAIALEVETDEELDEEAGDLHEADDDDPADWWKKTRRSPDGTDG